MTLTMEINMWTWAVYDLQHDWIFIADNSCSNCICAACALHLAAIFVALVCLVTKLCICSLLICNKQKWKVTVSLYPGMAMKLIMLPSLLFGGS